MPEQEWRRLLGGEILDFDEGMNLLVVYINEVCTNYCDGCEEGKGASGYRNRGVTDEEHKAMRGIELILWREHLEMTGRKDEVGCCNESCYDCGFPRLQINAEDPRHHMHGDEQIFYCQHECECK